MEQQAKTFEEIAEILSKVTYKDWTLNVIRKSDETTLMQWVFMERDNTNPSDTALYPQHCRKWFISHYSTTSEIIRSAFKAAVTAELHEAEECFMYDGVRLFDPHTDLVELTNFMSTAKQDVRA